MTSVNGPQTNYNNLLNAGELQSDAAQARAIQSLQILHDKLAERREAPSGGLLGRLFGRKADVTPPARGLYIWGDVGRGKSMCMDLFFASAPVEKKRRVHFHAFMLEAHAEMHRWRNARREAQAKGKPSGDGDTIPPLADKIAAEAQLLCFDEFQVTDVADAMILGRLFKELNRRGVTIVTTSNRPPEDLYKDGLNRQLFLPFIDMIRAEMDVLELSGPTDYRLDRLGGEPVFYTPVNDATTARLVAMFFRMTDHDPDDRDAVPSATIEIPGQGRTLYVPKALKGVAVFSFKRLCANALGAADYLAIAHHYHTVILVAVPRLDPEKRNEAKRFVTLIDALYENNVKLICSAETEPAGLYPAGDGSFEFERTVSRLMEMQSADYLARGHGIT